MSPALRTAVVIGNPKPGSRTREAGLRVAEELTGSAPEVEIELAGLAADLATWGAPAVDEAIEDVLGCDLVIVASPTFKATYTGLLKLFLDQFAYDAWQDLCAVPVMVGAQPHHALAVETHLRPVLVELGAVVPTRGLYVLQDEVDHSAAYRTWAETARRRLGIGQGSRQPDQNTRQQEAVTA